MNKSKIESLKKQRDALHQDYRLAAIEKVTADEEFMKRLAAISEEIHMVDAAILAERMPVEVEEI